MNQQERSSPLLTHGDNPPPPPSPEKQRRRRRQQQRQEVSAFVWLGVFCATGVGLGLSFEFLILQSNDYKPVAEETFFLCFIGYWAQTLVGLLYTASLYVQYRRGRATLEQQQQQRGAVLSAAAAAGSAGTAAAGSAGPAPASVAAAAVSGLHPPSSHAAPALPPSSLFSTSHGNDSDDGGSDNSSSTKNPNPLRGTWSPAVLRVLVVSALFDGAAQALDFIGQLNGGYLIFTIFHSSVTVFSCAIAVLLLRAKVSRGQWAGVLLVVVGILTTALPTPLAVEGNFMLGLICSLSGSLCLAASYPFSELVFRIGGRLEGGAVSEEAACTVGSFANTAIFSLWTAAYTAPRWKEEVTSYTKPGRGTEMAFGFALYGAMVGLHSLSFWKSIHKLGTVPTAVAKGAQQAGIFVFSHLVYCRIDRNECLTYNYGNSLWNKMQKSVAFCFCTAGVVVYALNKRKEHNSQLRRRQHDYDYDYDYDGGSGNGNNAGGFLSSSPEKRLLGRWGSSEEDDHDDYATSAAAAEWQQER